MSKETFVFDHDGTLTDSEKLDVDYYAVYIANFAKKTHLSEDSVRPFINQQRYELLAHPELYGWKNEDGFVVAPATADPYVFMYVAARRALGDMRSANIPRIPDIYDEALFFKELLYESYPLVGSHYKPEAARMIEELLPFGKLVIVSNSKRVNLLGKLTPFLESHQISSDAIEVIGDAQKNVINPHWERVPQTTRFPGLERDVLLRREIYGNIVLKFGNHPYYVVGDSAELDLVTPQALQFRTVLAQGPFTPTWEVQAMNTTPTLEALTQLTIKELGK